MDSMKRRMDGRAVWSTDPNFVPPCETCGEPPERCRCRPEAAPPPGEQVARVHLERKGRGGKTVTVIEGILGPQDFLKEVARLLKEACGTGGTLKDEGIELQGDHRERAARALAAKGFRVKGAPG